MEPMTIELPESLRNYVRGRVGEGGYASVSDYLKELIRADQQRETGERIDSLLLDGINSGPPIAITPEYWEEKKRRLRDRPTNTEHQTG